MKKILYLLVVLNFFQAKTFSAILVEPYIGINVKGSSELVTAGEDKYDNAPISMGGRLGYSKLGFSLGFDYQMTNDVKMKNYNNDYDATELAVFAGFNFPILVRAYAGYIFSADFESDQTKYDEGSGYKLGVGFTALPFLNINLEYKEITYDKRNNVVVDLADHNAVLLAISLPLKFF